VRHELADVQVTQGLMQAGAIVVLFSKYPGTGGQLVPFNTLLAAASQVRQKVEVLVQVRQEKSQAKHRNVVALAK